MEKFTEKEIAVLNVYVNDCFVADYGWDDPCSGMWSQGIGDDVDFPATEVSGVISSLVKKGILCSNGATGRDATICLTEKGIKAVRNCDEIDTPY